MSSHIGPSCVSPAIIAQISLFCIIFIQGNANAFEFTDKICQEYGLGANWYCKGEIESEHNEINASDILSSNSPAEQKAIELNKLWDTQIKRATITGSKKDIEEFLATHFLITSKGIEFSKNVQKIIDHSPQLSNTNSYYKNAVDEQIKKEEATEILAANNGRYGLVLVYSTTCAHCARQVPIIQQFARKYNFQTLGITTDIKVFSGFDQNIVDPQITRDPLVQAYPTILLLDKKNPTKIFVARGLTTLDELEEKIVNKIKERQEEGRL